MNPGKVAMLAESRSQPSFLTQSHLVRFFLALHSERRRRPTGLAFWPLTVTEIDFIPTPNGRPGGRGQKLSDCDQMSFSAPSR